MCLFFTGIPSGEARVGLPKATARAPSDAAVCAALAGYWLFAAYKRELDAKNAAIVAIANTERKSLFQYRIQGAVVFEDKSFDMIRYSERVVALLLQRGARTNRVCTCPDGANRRR